MVSLCVCCVALFCQCASCGQGWRGDVFHLAFPSIALRSIGGAVTWLETSSRQERRRPHLVLAPGFWAHWVVVVVIFGVAGAQIVFGGPPWPKGHLDAWQRGSGNDSHLVVLQA